MGEENHKGNENIRTLPPMTSDNCTAMVAALNEVQRIATGVRNSLEGAFLREQIIEIVEGFYDIGTVDKVFEIFGGTTNRSFGIVVHQAGCRKRFFLRKYKTGITGEEIRFEHALITHAIANGLTIGAGIVMTRRGDTFVTPANSNSIFAVYAYLKGEDRYSWDNPYVTDAEFRSAGRLLAEFHNAVRDFDPGDLHRKEPPILMLWRAFPEKLAEFGQQAHAGKVRSYFREHFPRILDTMARHRFEPADAEGMPVIATHYDYHPGNLKWDGEQVVGIFDFDWSKMDLRLFDVCMAVVYFCSHWRENHDGEMRLDKLSLFLHSYQQRLKMLDGLEPITAVEIQMLPTMLTIANIYLLHWTVAAFRDKAAANEYEYLAYLKHNVRLMRWLESHRSDMANTAAGALAASQETSGHPAGSRTETKK